MNEMINISELKAKLREFDSQHLDWGKKQYWSYAQSIDPSSIRALLIDDIKFRAKTGKNVVATCYGEQGEGKSMFMSSLGIIIGKIYGKPFDVKDIYYSAIELDNALEKSEPKQTFLRDEQSNSQHGEMSNMINENLQDYEEQLRVTQNNLLFASVRRHEHASFFEFQAWLTNIDPITKLPVSVTAILNTPLTHEPNMFVPRGFVTLPAPDDGFLKAYDLRKREYTQKNLKDKQTDNVFSQIKPFAEKIISLRVNDMIETTKDGFVLPLKEELIKNVVYEVIGSRKMTTSGYRTLFSYLRREIKQKFSEHNLKVNELVEKRKEQKLKQKLDLLEKKQELDLKAREQREKIQREKLEAENKKIELGKLKLALKEQTIKGITQHLNNSEE